MPMAILNNYVKLPEGILFSSTAIYHVSDALHHIKLMKLSHQIPVKEYMLKPFVVFTSAFDRTKHQYHYHWLVFPCFDGHMVVTENEVSPKPWVSTLKLFNLDDSRVRPF